LVGGEKVLVAPTKSEPGARLAILVSRLNDAFVIEGLEADDIRVTFDELRETECVRQGDIATIFEATAVRTVARNTRGVFPDLNIFLDYIIFYFFSLFC
jgi:uroporphyrinogen-III synthase